MRLPIVCALLMVVGATAGHGQQRDTLPLRDTLPALGVRVHAEIGVVLGYEVLREPFADDVQFPIMVTETEPGVIVRAGAEYRFRYGVGTFAVLGGSIARATLTEEHAASSSTTTAGTTTQFDLMAGLGWRPPIRQREPEPVSLHAAGGAVWISGPDDFGPYTRYEDRTAFFLWEVGLSVHPGGRFGGTVAYQTIDVEPPVNENDGRIHRIVLALRVGGSG